MNENNCVVTFGGAGDAHRVPADLIQEAPWCDVESPKSAASSTSKPPTPIRPVIHAMRETIITGTDKWKNGWVQPGQRGRILMHNCHIEETRILLGEKNISFALKSRWSFVTISGTIFIRQLFYTNLLCIA